MPGYWGLNWQQVGSAGLVPGAPCSQWRYRYTFLQPVFFADPVLGLTTIYPQWDLQVLDSGGGVLWEQAVKMTLMVEASLSGLAGYNILSETDTVTTTTPSGITTGANGSAGAFVQLDESPTWGLGLEVGFWCEWLSTVQAQALPVGAKFHVKLHTTGLAGLKSVYAPLAVAAEPASSFATFFDLVNIHRVVAPHNGEMVHLFSRDGARHYDRRRLGLLYDAPSVRKLADNSLLVLGQLPAAGWQLSRSLNDGLTWEATVAEPWDATYTGADFDVLNDGVVVTTARSGGNLYARTSRDQYASAVLIGPASADCRISCHKPSGKLLATDGVSVTYLSDDSGQTWYAQTGALIP